MGREGDEGQGWDTYLGVCPVWLRVTREDMAVCLSLERLEVGDGESEGEEMKDKR